MLYRIFSAPLFVSFLFVAGCASQHLGPEATLTDPEQYLPLRLSATYQPQVCSGYFGYLTFSLTNRSPEWLRFRSARVSFPYQSEEEIRVIVGEDLDTWQDSRVLMVNREGYNANLMSLVITAAGLAMIMSDDKEVQTVGAGALIMNEAIQVGEELRDEYREAQHPLSLEPNKHLLNGAITIPPLMDRQYWLLLNSSASAPLLTELILTLADWDGVDYEYRIPLNNWKSCGWQMERKAMLENWAREAGYTTRGFDRSSGDMIQRVNKSLPELEHLYQQAVSRQALVE